MIKRTCLNDKTGHWTVFAHRPSGQLPVFLTRYDFMPIVAPICAMVGTTIMGTACGMCFVNRLSCFCNFRMDIVKMGEFVDFTGLWFLVPFCEVSVRAWNNCRILAGLADAGA